MNRRAVTILLSIVASLIWFKAGCQIIDIGEQRMAPIHSPVVSNEKGPLDLPYTMYRFHRDPFDFKMIREVPPQAAAGSKLKQKVVKPKLELQGVVQGRNSATALIRTQDRGAQTTVVTVGDTLDGFVVHTISTDSLVLKQLTDGQLVRIP